MFPFCSKQANDAAKFSRTIDPLSAWRLVAKLRRASWRTFGFCEVQPMTSELKITVGRKVEDGLQGFVAA